MEEPKEEKKLNQQNVDNFKKNLKDIPNKK